MDTFDKMLNPALWPTRHYSTITSIQMKLILIYILVLNAVFAYDHDMEVNYDIGHYKLLQVNQTLELICKNLLNRSPPSWTYHSRLHNDPRMKLSADVAESRLVISKATAEDAGQYVCSIDHEHNGKTFHFNRTIEVIVNEIRDVKVEEQKDSIKLLCDVQAYPSATVIWKIDYDNKTLNPLPEEPDEDDYWVPPDEKVVVDKSEERLTLRPYKGVNNAELIIADVTENDNGQYFCCARNVAGEMCKDCTVRVTREAAGTVKSTTVTSGNSKAVKPETDNSQEGLGVGTIVAISVMAVIIVAILLGLLRTIVTTPHQNIRRNKYECMKSPNNDVQEIDTPIITSTATSLPADEPWRL